MRRLLVLPLLLAATPAGAEKTLTDRQLAVRLAVGPRVRPEELAVGHKVSAVLGFRPNVPALSSRQRDQILLRRARELVATDPYGSLATLQAILGGEGKGKAKREARALLGRARRALAHWTPDDFQIARALDTSEEVGSLELAVPVLFRSIPPELRLRAERRVLDQVGRELDRHLTIYEAGGRPSLHAAQVLHDLAWLRSRFRTRTDARSQFALWARVHPQKLDDGLRAKMDAVKQRLERDARTDPILRALLDGHYDGTDL